jgi:hypothetical protein
MLVGARLRGGNAAKPPGLTLPERNQDVNQRDDGQPQMADPRANPGQQIVGLGVARQPDAENCGKQQHGSALTFAYAYNNCLAG